MSLEDRTIGDRNLYGPVHNLTTSAFIEDDTRITVTLPERPDSAVQYVLHIGLSGCTFQADRDDLTRLRDTITEALEAGSPS